MEIKGDVFNDKFWLEVKMASSIFMPKSIVTEEKLNAKSAINFCNELNLEKARGES